MSRIFSGFHVFSRVSRRSAAPELLPNERASNQAPRPKGFRNIPSSEADESSYEFVEVRDPRHPLYSKRFRVLRHVTSSNGSSLRSYEVEFGQNHSLLIPVSVTEPYDTDANQITLSIDSLRELLSTVECLERHEHGSKGSLVNITADSATSNRRGGRFRSGGALP
jgi:hypothetical protein